MKHTNNFSVGIMIFTLGVLGGVLLQQLIIKMVGIKIPFIINTEYGRIRKDVDSIRIDGNKCSLTYYINGVPFIIDYKNK